MKILKILSIISFLLLEGVDQHGTFTIILMLLTIYQFFHDLFQLNFDIDLSLGMLATVLVIITLVIFYKCRRYKDRYVQLLCFICLLICSIYFSGIMKYNIITGSYIITFLIFIISSIALIIWNFKSPEKEN